MFGPGLWAHPGMVTFTIFNRTSIVYLCTCSCSGPVQDSFQWMGKEPFGAPSLGPNPGISSLQCLFVRIETSSHDIANDKTIPLSTDPQHTNTSQSFLLLRV